MNYWSRPEVVRKYIASLDKSKKGGSALAQDIFDLIATAIGNGYALGTDLIVDIGSGPGNVSAAIIESFGLNAALLIDSSEAMLDEMPWHIDLEKIRVTSQRADISLTPFNTSTNSVDVAIACRSLMYLKDLRHVFSEAARVLKQNGLFGFNCMLHAEEESPYLCEFLSVVQDLAIYAFSKKIFHGIINANGFEIISVKEFINDTYASIPIEYNTYLLRKK